MFILTPSQSGKIIFVGTLFFRKESFLDSSDDFNTKVFEVTGIRFSKMTDTVWRMEIPKSTVKYLNLIQFCCNPTIIWIYIGNIQSATFNFGNLILDSGLAFSNTFRILKRNQTHPVKCQSGKSVLPVFTVWTLAALTFHAVSSMQSATKWSRYQYFLAAAEQWKKQLVSVSFFLIFFLSLRRVIYFSSIRHGARDRYIQFLAYRKTSAYTPV